MNRFYMVAVSGATLGWCAHLLLVRGLARLRHRREVMRIRAARYQQREQERFRRSVAARKGHETRRARLQAREGGAQ